MSWYSVRNTEVPYFLGSSQRTVSKWHNLDFKFFFVNSNAEIIVKNLQETGGSFDREQYSRIGLQVFVGSR